MQLARQTGRTQQLGRVLSPDECPQCRKHALSLTAGEGCGQGHRKFLDRESPQAESQQQGKVQGDVCPTSDNYSVLLDWNAPFAQCVQSTLSLAALHIKQEKDTTELNRPLFPAP